MKFVKFTAPRPGVWLREDIADIAQSLVPNAPSQDYINGLVDMSIALGIRVTDVPNQQIVITKPK